MIVELAEYSPVPTIESLRRISLHLSVKQTWCAACRFFGELRVLEKIALVQDPQFTTFRWSGSLTWTAAVHRPSCSPLDVREMPL